MLRHLKHVRYVRPATNWLDGRSGASKWFLTSSQASHQCGVLCGLYLTDLVSLRNVLYGEGIAVGSVDLQLNGTDKGLIRRPRLIDGFYTAG
ncbi:hypothetical protein PF008_g9547 [Phytophthora fragariae]|uniref:Uncharacterized protein n=1 Tax=Phytophthora fragariae TaxID=53985 RepID=A0A6G0RWI4_9STRA|nr:hypothetical protein PF008_g9547 [Phytophthora fragariae]